MQKQQQQQHNESDDDFFEFWTPMSKKPRTEVRHHSPKSSPLIPSLQSRRGDNSNIGTTLPPSSTPEEVGEKKSKEAAPRTV